MRCARASAQRLSLATGFLGTGVIVEFNARVVLDKGWGEDSCWVKSDNTVKTGSSRLGTDERGKCDSVGLSAECLSNEATIRSVVVAVA